MPADLMRAIQFAGRVLDWQENLSIEEQPPQWLWCFEDELEAWFDEVKRSRDSNSGGSGGDTEAEEGYMTNDLARDRH